MTGNNDINTGRQERAYSPAIVLLIGITLGVVLGFFDLAISMAINGPSEIASYGKVLASLTATILFFLTAYFIIFYSATFLFSRLKIRKSIPFAMAVALFLASAFIYFMYDASIHLYILSLPEAINLLLIKLAIMIGISLVISIIIFVAVDIFLRKKDYSSKALSLSIMIPFLAIEIFSLVWMFTVWITRVFYTPSLLIIACGLISSFFVVYLFYRPDRNNTLKKISVSLIVVFVLAFFMQIAMTTQPADNELKVQKRNNQIKHIILITIDTLRTDVLSCYNSDARLTPHIDAIANDGILFSNAISSSSWTLPGVASLITGVSVNVHMATNLKSRISKKFHTLAEYMYEAGYTTGAIGDNFVLSSRGNNLSQGFMDFDFFPKQAGRGALGTFILQRLFHAGFLVDVTTTEITDLACKWLDENKEKDSFLWVHYLDPHIPYTPPEKYIPENENTGKYRNKVSHTDLERIRNGSFKPTADEKKWIKLLYASEVQYVDEYIGKLTDKMKQLNIFNDSLIIITSDHGEEFWDHDGFEHGHTLYNELIRVPLIIKLPVSAKEEKIDDIISTVSVTPTILDLCRIRYNSGSFSTPSLTKFFESDNPAVRDEPVESRGTLYGEDKEAIIFDGLKYIHNIGSDTEELYNLIVDPKEQESLVSASSGKINAAKNILKKNYQSDLKTREHYNITESNEKGGTLDFETAKQLKSLGYIQ